MSRKMNVDCKRRAETIAGLSVVTWSFIITCMQRYHVSYKLVESQVSVQLTGCAATASLQTNMQTKQSAYFNCIRESSRPVYIIIIQESRSVMC